MKGGTGAHWPARAGLCFNVGQKRGCPAQAGLRESLGT